MTIFDDLYDSEINATITWFWDSDFEVTLGDKMNGIKCEISLKTWRGVEAWLTEKAVKHFPETEFAGKYGKGVSNHGK